MSTSDISIDRDPAVAGRWTAKLTTPMGAQTVVLNFATSGTELSGSLEAPHPLGYVEFAGGTVDGNKLAYTANVTSPMPLAMEFNATVSGDTISGTVKLGDFGDSTFEGTRDSGPATVSAPAGRSIGEDYRPENHRHPALSPEWVEKLRKFCVVNDRFAVHNLPPISIKLSWEFSGAPADLLPEGQENLGFYIELKDGKAVEVGGVPPKEADGRIIMDYNRWLPVMAMTLDEDMEYMTEIFSDPAKTASIRQEGDVAAFGPYVLILRKEFFPVHTA